MTIHRPTSSILLAPLFVFLQNSPFLLLFYNLLLPASACAALIQSSYSDFVRSSLASDGTHLKKNHESQSRNSWVPVQKTTSSTLKVLGFNVLKQAVTESEDRLQNSLSKVTEINIIIVVTTKVRRLKFKQQPHNQLHKSHGRTFLQRNLQMDRSLRPTGCIH